MSSEKQTVEDTKFSVEIDPYQLDQEWVNQPRFYHEYAIQLAAAKRDLDEWKNELEVVRARLYSRISADPAAFELKKTTEEAIKNAVTLEGSYQEVMSHLIEARHAVAVLEAVVSALDQRKKALESLVQLHLSDYYSQPRAKGLEREVVAEFEKQEIRRRGRRKVEG